MPNENLVDAIPLVAMFAFSVIIVLGSIQLGLVAGLRRRRKSQEPEGPVGSVVAAMLGLLAFMLAFTFGSAASRFETRKELLLGEVNAIGTAVLRADLLPEPQRGEIRALLTRYVEIRIDLAAGNADIPKLIADAESIQSEIWSRAMVLARADLNSDIGAIFLTSLNEVFDLHTARLTVTLHYRIPTSIWATLVVVTIFSMAAVGYQFGLAGRGSHVVNITLAITFSSVVWLIADLDRPVQGVLRVSQQPMIELHQKMNATK